MTGGAALYFDKETDAAIRRLWQVIDDAGLPSKMLSLAYPPHMTILVCENSDLEAMREALGEFVAHQPPIELNFHSLGVFNTPDGVIYLAPVTDQHLLAFHSALWTIMEPHSKQVNELYRPGKWVPHITLNVEVPADQIGDVMEALMRVDIPKTGRLTSLFVADFLPEPPAFEELFKQRFGSRAAAEHVQEPM